MSPSDEPNPHPDQPLAPAESAADGVTATSPGSAVDEPEAVTDDLETVRAELAEMTSKADEYLRLAQRIQADFVNYRRRVEEERTQQLRDAGIAYVLRLLPVLDDFERALSSATPEELESSWGQGIALVERNLRGILAAEDVQRISAEGAEFDPREHEALGGLASADVPEGHVLHVIRHGYRKGERVLRPAQVIVAAAPQD